MARHPQDITEAELSVLQALWDRQSATIRQLSEALYPQGGQVQYATVQKLLERLEAKDFVHRDRSAAVHVFTPAVNRDELIGRRLRSLAEQLCGGSLTPLLTHLVKTRRLTAREREELRALIKATEPKSGRRPDAKA